MSKILVDSEEYFRLKNNYKELAKRYNAIKAYNNAKLTDDNDASGIKRLYIDLLTKRFNLKDVTIIENNLQQIQQLKDEIKTINKNLNDKEKTIQGLKSTIDNINLEKKILQQNLSKLTKQLNKSNQEKDELNKMIEEFNYVNHKQPKKGISIILTAWQTQKFIEESLDSIEQQTYFANFNDYEILLGIDGCEKTLEKVKKYNTNIEIFVYL